MDKIIETTLQQLKIQTNNFLTSRELERFCNDLRLNMIMPEMIDGMVIQLSGWVWAKKPDRREVITGSIQVPDGWYNHLKDTIFVRHKWFRKIHRFLVKHKLSRPIKFRTELVRREVELQVFYPTLNVLSHEPYLNLVELETSKDNYYEESK